MAVVLLAVAAGLVWAFLPKPVAVDVAAVDRGMLRVTVDQEGKTRVRERYVVSAPLAGKLQRISLKAGDAVAARETLLAQIEPVEPQLLDVRARAEAEARVRAMEASVARAEAMRERAQTSLEWALAEVNRLRVASEQDAVTPRELDQARTAQRTAERELQAADLGRQVAAFELEQARAALMRTMPAGTTQPATEPESGPFAIRSPISGRVLRVIQESAAVVQAGEPLLEIGDPNDLEMVIDVLSTDAVRIVPGASVIIERWGGPRDLAGKVRLIEPSGFTKISALGVEEQRVNVIADFDAPPAERSGLGDAFRVEARIVIWEEPNVVKAPMSALFRGAGRGGVASDQAGDWLAYVVKGDRASLRAVRLGRQNGLEAQVLEGLEAGEQVILHPSDRIADGVRVKVP